MATILAMVQTRKDEFQNNPVLATQSMALAINAMKEGMKSKAWEYFMSQFVDRSSQFSQDQLARLTATDDTEGDPVMDRRRAYLVANSICGPSTTPGTDVGIESIDDGLDNVRCARKLFDCDTTTFAAPAAPRPPKAPKPPSKRPIYAKPRKR